MVGIYCITNTINGKIYIGSSRNTNKRWAGHLRQLRNGCHPNRHLQTSFIKHGEQAFRFDVIEETQEDQLIAREQHYIDTTGCLNRKIGYNIYPKADGSKHSPETIERMSKAQMGNKSRLGQKHKPETIELMRKKAAGRNRGRKLSDAHKEAIRQGNLGRICTTRRPVKQSKNGQIVAIFDSIEDAKKATGLTNIISVCQGKRKSAGGYIWEYV